MTFLSKSYSTDRISWLKRLFGSAVIFASLAAAGQADSLYPQEVPLLQTADVSRPDARSFVKVESRYPQTMTQTQSADVARASGYRNNCTQLELSARILPAECGTLTLADVVSRGSILGHDGRGD